MLFILLCTISTDKEPLKTFVKSRASFCRDIVMSQKERKDIFTSLLLNWHDLYSNPETQIATEVFIFPERVPHNIHQSLSQTGVRERITDKYVY